MSYPNQPRKEQVQLDLLYKLYPWASPTREERERTARLKRVRERQQYFKYVEIYLSPWDKSQSGLSVIDKIFHQLGLL